jgi:hypothetical protein
MRISCFNFLFVIILALFPGGVSSQVSSGGIPPSYSLIASREAIDQKILPSPDYQKLLKENDSLMELGYPERMGVILQAGFNPSNSGTWTELDNSTMIWRMNIEVKDAVALGLYFTNFSLSKGEQLFIYSSDKSRLIGAFTEYNNKESGFFATEIIKGEAITVELVISSSNRFKNYFSISEVLVAFTDLPYDIGDNLRQADPCEVNVSCVEGDKWRDQINGVMRIQARNGSIAYWCTGALMNNTALDFSPLILTADHCALYNNRFATPADLQRWVFYFKYESRTCVDNTPTIPRTITGAIKLASSSPVLNDGSDFYLVRLLENVPNSYQPYYNGWNALNQLSNSGVTIHHPDGDVKKISTYFRPLELSEWGNIPSTHFRVIWSQTPNGHGVTEGGSSGAPLFNEEGSVIGQLTGGESDCTEPNKPDYFGRIFYSWDKIGSNDTSMLSPWLDPLNSGLRELKGTYTTVGAIAQFAADRTVVSVDEEVYFRDLSSNNPSEWSWTFEGGNPTSSTAREPGYVTYTQLGSFDVRLIVSNSLGQDTVVIKDYIRVVPVIYPNPTRNEITLRMGRESNQYDVAIINSIGKVVTSFIVNSEEPSVNWSFKEQVAGFYLVRIRSGNDVQYHKLLYIP